ncbi:AAA family ATPase [Sporosarcina sp. Marseille-Q4063]|uniref:AAA domain-containing protein n=1 Tax=Sporosarcina sp. Marseille-Q4063 TaxID=2810514 RepID=UPI001BAF8F12|nr:AAA domain-containing protein [Sporosarcina sp. Marseille-Q4063]QUW23012.1 AAA family ATPase [Sporosarcina sp. Marseille-Q4063]
MVTYRGKKEGPLAVSREINQSRDVINYLQELSAHIGFKNNGKSILLNQYEKLGKPNRNSVLAHYLSETKITNEKYEDPLIFPFGVNLSQKEAVKKAVENSISVIEGPPGTGKTQTILNVIANVVAKGQSVAIVSGNNSATENVQEKLEEYNFGFMTSLLGNYQNRKDFFEKYQPEVPDMIGWKLEDDERVSSVTHLQMISDELTVLLEDQREMAKLKEELAKLQVEQRYFEKEFKDAYIDVKKYSFYKKWSSQRIINFITQLEGINPSGKPTGFMSKVKLFIQYGVYKQRVITKSRTHIINSLKKDYYIKSIENRKSKINVLENRLENKSYQALLEEYEEISSRLFKGTLNQKFANLIRKKGKYSIGNYKYKFQDFVKEYPVVLSTTHSILTSIPDGFLFDYLIIDEASQVDLVTGSLALACCKNIVIVGDVKQLPHIVPTEIEEISDDLFANTGINNAYNYSEYSIISSFMALYKESLPVTLLSEHYRCHPKIIGFCNERFYDNQLIVMTEEDVDDQPLKIYKTAPGNHARRNNTGREIGWYNVRQIEVVRDEILHADLSRYGSCSGVGVISPFRMHVKETKKYIQYPALEVDTVHRFQGREKKTIIFTTVANDITPFIDDANLINVAVSRAVDELIIVTSDRLFKQQGSYLGDLIRYVEYNSFSNVIESQKVSVFDLLYTEYSSALLKYRTTKENVSEFESENLMYAVIKEVLSLPEFRSFKCVMHIPLNSLFRNFSNLTEEERKFAENPWSHVDFLIFNRLDKEALLAIEVDGVMFHRNDEKQENRDALKNSIFSKNNLPLLRVATNESGEKEKLINMLMEIIKS